MEALDTLLYFLTIATYIVLIMLASIGALYLATSSNPIDPSLSHVAKRHDIYIDAQVRLLAVRAARKRAVHEEPTRPMRLSTVTIAPVRIVA